MADRKRKSPLYADTVVGWTDRNAVTFTRVPSEAHKFADNLPSGTRFFTVTLDRDGAEKKITLDWFELPDEEPATTAYPVVAFLRLDCLTNVALVRAGSMEEQIAIIREEFVFPDEPSSDYLQALIANVQKNASSALEWMGEIELKKLVASVDDVIIAFEA